MRQSIRSMAASERASVNESLIVEAVTQYIENLQGQQNAPSVHQSMEGSLTQSRLNTVADEVIADKMARIIDELKKEAEVQQS